MMEKTSRYAWYDRDSEDPRGPRRLTPERETVAEAVGTANLERWERAGVCAELCSVVTRGGREHLRAVVAGRIRKACKDSRGAWTLWHAGGAYGPCDDIPRRPLLVEVSEGAARWMCAAELADMRRRCGPNSWDDHFFLTMRCRDGMVLDEDGFPV